MKHIVIIGFAVLVMFFLIAFNLSDYNSRNNDIKEKKESEIAEMERRKGIISPPSKWDKVKDAKEKLQSTSEPSGNDENSAPVYSIVTDENGNISGYQPVKNVVYDDENNIISYDEDGDMISPEDYENMAAVTEPAPDNELSITKRTAPSARHDDEKFTIVVN